MRALRPSRFPSAFPLFVALHLTLSLLVAGSGGAAASSEDGAAAPAAPGLGVPRLAYIVRQSGTVLVEALVDTTGAVRATNVVRSVPLLDDSATVEVARRRFPPARSPEGAAVASVRTVPVTFQAPPEDDEPRWPAFVETRCAPFALALDPDFRPDSTGALAIRWTARGLRSHELRLLVLTPDGVTVDTTGSFLPQRLLDTLDPAVPGWPTWLRSGKQLRENQASGTIPLRLPAPAPWWSTGRIAIVGLFHDVVDRTWVVRQAVYRIEHDAMGALLVRDASVDECRAGPFRR